MIVFRLRRIFAKLITDVSLKVVMAYCLIYIVASYALLFFAQEKDIVAGNNFFYWIVVTSSTVGYGDFSPTTLAGKLITSFFVIPVGLSLFALTITNAGIRINAIFQRKLKGLHMSQTNNHFLIIGYHKDRTPKLINLLHNDTSDKKIMLCVKDDMNNPHPEFVELVKVDSFSDANSMQRTNLGSARSIIIDSELDDETLRAALYCKSVNNKCHITAYFQDDSVAKLLNDLHPSIEIVPSVAIEMLVKASVDPGSSLLHQQLLDNTIGMTQFSDAYDGDETSVQSLFVKMKEEDNATLIAIKEGDSADMVLNPKPHQTISTGDTLYYICQHRIDF